MLQTTITDGPAALGWEGSIREAVDRCVLRGCGRGWIAKAEAAAAGCAAAFAARCWKIDVLGLGEMRSVYQVPVGTKILAVELESSDFVPLLKWGRSNDAASPPLRRFEGLLKQLYGVLPIEELLSRNERVVELLVPLVDAGLFDQGCLRRESGRPAVVEWK